MSQDPFPQLGAHRVSDLRGALRLTTDATAGLTDLVEAMHARISRVPGLRAPTPDDRTRGITGLVYKTIRGITRGVGGGVDALLALLPAAPADAAGRAGVNPQREALVAALNGVLGDHLLATGNPLATPMTLHSEGRPVVLERSKLAQRLPTPAPRLLVLLHGLCMNDLQWRREGHDHGVALARQFGYAPLYLRYNSGLHVSVNGRALADLFERLIREWPYPLERFTLLCHSMGGLLARSALHHGMQAGHRWPDVLNDLVFLGTPHHGAPLERAGHWVDLVLGATPYAAPFARLGKVRSAGITDLRHANLVDADWAANDRSDATAQRRHRLPQAVPLPSALRCFAAAASLERDGSRLRARLLGDGLVPLDSALGQHRDVERTLAFPADRQWVGQGMNHLELLNRAEVFEQLRRWLGKH